MGTGLFSLCRVNMPCIVNVGVNFELKFVPNSSRPVKLQTTKSFSRGLATTKVDFDLLSKMTQEKKKKKYGAPSEHAPYFLKKY